MNDQERTELERLVAATGPAGPSEELDARVREALSDRRVAILPHRDRGPDRRLSLAVAASLLIAAGIGFLGGRLTADSGNSASDLGPSLQVTGSPDTAEGDDVSISAAPSAVAAQTTRIPLPDEQLASLFVQTRSREGLLGAGPVRVEVSRLP